MTNIVNNPAEDYQRYLFKQIASKNNVILDYIDNHKDVTPEKIEQLHGFNNKIKNYVMLIQIVKSVIKGSLVQTKNAILKSDNDKPGIVAKLTKTCKPIVRFIEPENINVNLGDDEYLALIEHIKIKQDKKGPANLYVLIGTNILCSLLASQFSNFIRANEPAILEQPVTDKEKTSNLINIYNNITNNGENKENENNVNDHQFQEINLGEVFNLNEQLNANEEINLSEEINTYPENNQHDIEVEIHAEDNFKNNNNKRQLSVENTSVKKLKMSDEESIYSNESEESNHTRDVQEESVNFIDDIIKNGIFDIENNEETTSQEKFDDLLENNHNATASSSKEIEDKHLDMLDTNKIDKQNTKIKNLLKEYKNNSTVKVTPPNPLPFNKKLSFS